MNNNRACKLMAVVLCIAVFMCSVIVVSADGGESLPVTITFINAIDKYGERVAWVPYAESLVDYYRWSGDNSLLKYFGYPIFNESGWQLYPGAEWSWMNDISYYNLYFQNQNFYPYNGNVVGADFSFYTRNLNAFEYEFTPIFTYQTNGGIDDIQVFYDSSIVVTNYSVGNFVDEDDGSATSLNNMLRYDVSYRVQYYEMIDYVREWAISNGYATENSFDVNLVSLGGFRVRPIVVRPNSVVQIFNLTWGVSQYINVVSLSQDEYTNELNNAISGKLDDINTNITDIKDYESGVDIDTPKNEFDSSSGEYADLEDELMGSLDDSSIGDQFNSASGAIDDFNNNYVGAFEVVSNCFATFSNFRGIDLIIVIVTTLIIIGVLINNRPNFRGVDTGKVPVSRRLSPPKK